MQVNWGLAYGKAFPVCRGTFGASADRVTCGFFGIFSIFNSQNRRVLLPLRNSPQRISEEIANSVSGIKHPAATLRNVLNLYDLKSSLLQ